MEKPRRSHFDGVIHDPADLQKPIVRIEIQKEAFLDLRKFFFTSALIVLLIDAGVIGISSFIHARTAKADTIFYPATCLGGWTNPNNAEGKPDVSDPTQLTNFSDTNSAVLSSDTGGEIYCGGFTGEVPPDTLPRTLTISFSMAAKQSAAPASPNEDTTLPPGIVSALEGTTTPNSGIPSSDETTPHASSSDEVTVPSSPSQNAPVDGSSTQASSSSGSVLPLPENMDSSSQGSQTFFWFGDTAYAADDSIASSSATSPAADTNATTSSNGESLLEADYTLDGTNWQELGTLTADNLNASFVLPLAVTSTWNDVAKIQIRLQSLPVSEKPTIYLDGMNIRVDYVEAKPEIKNKPSSSIDLTDGASIAEDQLPSVVVHPAVASDNANMIFYVVYDSGQSTYVAETRVHGDAPLSDYFAPLPGPGTYRMIEYDTENGQFECNGLSARSCAEDPHFLSKTDFSVTAASTSDATISGGQQE